MVDLAAPGNINSSSYRVPDRVPHVCFRTYDIRGPVDAAHLTPDLAYAIGLAIGTEAQAQGEQQVIVGRDGRLSGPELCQALCTGLQVSGVDVIFIGVVPTPVLYFATHHLAPRSGVMVTASHNPAHHNGFKIVLAGKTLSEEGVQALYQRICEQQFVYGAGRYLGEEVVRDYIQYIAQHITLQRPLKIVIDCGNGVAGDVAPTLFRALGCEVVELFCEVDGHFPNHHPDPTVPENLIDLIKTVQNVKADIGLAFDGDADRLGVVTDQGEIIWADRQMMLFSIDILAKHAGAEIIFDVKCSRNLPKVILEHGGKPLMWRTGHSLIKAKAFANDVPFAGELSGHLFFRDQWFGFDDGMYVGARLLNILARQSKTASEVFAELPNSVNTPELKVEVAEEKKADFMANFIEHSDFSDAKVMTIDGARIEYADGWALVRPSNTSPCLTVRFEADNEEALQRIIRETRQNLLRVDAHLKLHF